MTTVLVFEDDPDFGSELQARFVELGCTVRLFAAGEGALERASESKPDLIVVSADLGGGGGLSVCNKLKNADAVKDVPLVLLSTELWGGALEVHRELETRADEYVRRPIEWSELLDRIRAHVTLPGTLGDAPKPPGPNGGGASGVVGD